jgi:N-acetylglucosamine-6-phosphate deacetylase
VKFCMHSGICTGGNSVAITNARILTPFRMKTGGILINNGKIVDLFDGCCPIAVDHAIDAQGAYVSPGFIDLHTHGAGGFDFMDGTVEAMQGACMTHMAHGTTSLLPTTLCCSDPELFRVFAVLDEVINDKDWEGPEILGLHLEGPYFSFNQKGAQNEAYLREPDPQHYINLLNACPYIKRMTVAPELPGALELGLELQKRKILASIGHTDADYEQMLLAREYGYTFITHLYSGMSALHRKNAYRHLGAVESAYLIDDFMIEIIADGKHLPPELLRLILRNKAWDHICLITDSMRGAGMEEGSNPKLGSLKDGLDTVIFDGVAFLPDKTSFAGSVCTADRCIKTLVQSAGIPILDAVRMMTVNPARVMNVADRKGIIRTGMDADLCIFDENFTILGVMTRGILHMNNCA